MGLKSSMITLQGLVLLAFAMTTAVGGITLASRGAGAQAQVEQMQGKIVVIRQVPRRIAYRSAPPGPALEVLTAQPVNPPTDGIADFVVTVIPEARPISDSEAAQINAPVVASNPGGNGIGVDASGIVTNGTSITSSTVRTSGTSGILSGLGSRLTSQVGSFGNTVRSATAGVAGTVMNAVNPQ